MAGLRERERKCRTYDIIVSLLVPDGDIASLEPPVRRDGVFRRRWIIQVPLPSTHQENTLHDSEGNYLHDCLSVYPQFARFPLLCVNFPVLVLDEACLEVRQEVSDAPDLPG